MKIQLWIWGFFTGIWFLLLIPTLLWWMESTPWTNIMSWWANVAASAAAYLTIKSELDQRKARDESDHREDRPGDL